MICATEKNKQAKGDRECGSLETSNMEIVMEVRTSLGESGVKGVPNRWNS